MFEWYVLVNAVVVSPSGSSPPVLFCDDPTADNYDAGGHHEKNPINSLRHLLSSLFSASVVVAESDLRLVAARWTCTFAVYGCTDSLADTYNPLVATANSLRYLCQYGGCNDTEAINFNGTATYNDGTCEYPLIGCVVSSTPRAAATHTHTRWIPSCVHAGPFCVELPPGVHHLVRVGEPTTIEPTGPLR